MHTGYNKEKDKFCELAAAKLREKIQPAEEKETTTGKQQTENSKN